MPNFRDPIKVNGTSVVGKNGNVAGRFTVTAHKASVGASLTDVEIFEFTAPAALTLVGVQVYCTATAATASVTVKEAGVSVLSAAVTPTANTVVNGTISDANIASGAPVTVHVTTNSTGSVTDLTATLIFKEVAS